VFGKLAVNSWVAIREGCPMSYYVKGSAETDFRCGGERDGFEFAFEAEALREFLRIGTEALQDMDARFAREEAELGDAEEQGLASTAKGCGG
jgi:hypothetical protein